MLLVDNTAKLSQIMEFKPNTYYKFVALIRAKDCSSDNEQVLKCMEKQEILVKDWLIADREQLVKTLPDMLETVKLFKCRLYMCTDRKSVLKTLIEMRNQVNNYLDPFLFNNEAQCSVRAIKKIASSASNKDSASDKEGRMWLFDIDTNYAPLAKWIAESCGENYCETFQTKNGYHVIAKKKFYAEPLLKESVEYAYKNGLTKYMVSKDNTALFEVKSNAMVLVAMGSNDEE